MAHIKRFNEEYMWGGELSPEAITEIADFIKNRLVDWKVYDENLLLEGIKDTISKSMIMPHEDKPRNSTLGDDIDRRLPGYHH